MKKKLIIDYTIALTRIYLSLIFILSGLEKINNPEIFAQSIENYKLIPMYLVNTIAITLPWIELIAGGLLLIGIFVKENAFIILNLLIVFTIAVLIAVLRNLDIDCGCQGTSDGQKVGILKIIENISLIVISFVNIKFPNQVMTYLKK